MEADFCARRVPGAKIYRPDSGPPERVQTSQAVLGNINGKKNGQDSGPAHSLAEFPPVGQQWSVHMMLLRTSSGERPVERSRQLNILNIVPAV